MLLLSTALGQWLPAGQLDNSPGKKVTYGPQSQFCEQANWAIHLSNQVKSAQRKMVMTGQRSQCANVYISEYSIDGSQEFGKSFLL